MNKKNSLILTIVVCIVPMLAGLFLYNKLPDMIPVQWSGGEVSSFAPKWFVIVGLPAFFLLMNMFFYTKAEKSDLAERYPEAMKLFLKWSMPILCVVCTSLSFASAIGGKMTLAGVTSAVAMAVILFGSYIGRLAEVFLVRMVFSVKDENVEIVYSICGFIISFVGIISAFLSLSGMYIASFIVSIMALVLAVIYAGISGKK